MIKFDFFQGWGKCPLLCSSLRTSITVEININVFFTLCLANDYCIIVIIINTKSHYEVTISPEINILQIEKELSGYSGSNRWQLDSKTAKVASLSPDRGTLTNK